MCMHIKLPISVSTHFLNLKPFFNCKIVQSNCVKAHLIYETVGNES